MPSVDAIRPDPVPAEPRDEPVRRLFRVVEPASRQAVPDFDGVAAALAEVAADLDYLLPRIAAVGDQTGAWPLHAPPRGPRLMLVHRQEGQIGAVHDHGVWVAVAPIVGLETHRRYRRLAADASAGVAIADDRVVAPGEHVTLLPPDDIHDHGHVAGRGQPAWILILTGDDQTHYRRNEWQPETGRHRVLEVGDPGRWLAAQPFPTV